MILAQNRNKIKACDFQNDDKKYMKYEMLHTDQYIKVYTQNVSLIAQQIWVFQQVHYFKFSAQTGHESQHFNC